jgi:hypothetical protein
MASRRGGIAGSHRRVIAAIVRVIIAVAINSGDGRQRVGRFRQRGAAEGAAGVAAGAAGASAAARGPPGAGATGAAAAGSVVAAAAAPARSPSDISSDSAQSSRSASAMAAIAAFAFWAAARDGRSRGRLTSVNADCSCSCATPPPCVVRHSPARPPQPGDGDPGSTAGPTGRRILTSHSWYR